MRREQVLSLTLNRFREPSRWGVLVLVGGALCGIHFLTAPFRPNMTLLAGTFVLPFLLLALSPVPWQWSGDERLSVGPLRGLVQSLVFNGIWTGLIFLCLWFWGPNPDLVHLPPPGMPPGPPPGLPPGPPLGLPPELVVARLGFGVFALAAVTGFGWIWSEKEIAEAKERTMADVVKELEWMRVQDRLREEEREQLIQGLQDALKDNRVINGRVSDCKQCRKVRDEQGCWPPMGD